MNDLTTRTDALDEQIQRMRTELNQAKGDLDVFAELAVIRGQLDAAQRRIRQLEHASDRYSAQALVLGRELMARGMTRQQVSDLIEGAWAGNP
ncbi:hypothetical protein [Streptomyces sp. NPDC003395]